MKSLSAKGRNLYIFSAHLSNLHLYSLCLYSCTFSQSLPHTLSISVLVHQFHSISTLYNSPFAFIPFLLHTIFLLGFCPTCTLIPFQLQFSYHFTFTFNHQTFTIFVHCLLLLFMTEIISNANN